MAEKTEHMKKFAERLKISVDGYYASQGLMPLPVGEQILICTIEKANIVINQMIEDRRIQESEFPFDHLCSLVLLTSVAPSFSWRDHH